jgi:ATP-dependent DNA ligase
MGGHRRVSRHSIGGRAIVPPMRLPVMPPLEPMLAKAVTDLPRDGDWLFEPKWDGFRALVFRDGHDLTLQSRDRKPL